MEPQVEWNRSNITFITEAEVNSEAGTWFGVTVSLKMPPTANADVLNRHLITTAIAKKCKIIVFPSNVMRYHHDYLVRTKTAEETNLILAEKEFDISGYKLIVYPWSPLDGSTQQQLEDTPPNISQKVTPPKRTREYDLLENLRLTGQGLRPHLLKPNIIEKVFSNICPTTDFAMRWEDLSFTLCTYASRESIPATWTVALRKSLALYMWGLWITVENYVPNPLPKLNQDAMKNTRVKYNLYPGFRGGGGQSRVGGEPEDDGHSRQLLLLGYSNGGSPSRSDSSSKSGSPKAPERSIHWVNQLCAKLQLATVLSKYLRHN